VPVSVIVINDDLFSGEIPLRQLVYRVIDLPPSMKPLVYDFGQLNTGTELKYTNQIVSDHVCTISYIVTVVYNYMIMQVTNHPTLSHENPHIIPVISKVLAKSQEFMRNQNVRIIVLTLVY